MHNRYQYFSAAITSLYHDIQRVERLEMGKFGLKGPNAQCLMALSHLPEGITAARLCEITKKDKAAISRSIRQLEEGGLLRREGGYRAALLLTREGRQVAMGVQEKVRLAVEQAGEGLTEEDREVFYRVLATIAGNLHTICRDGLKEEME